MKAKANSKKKTVKSMGRFRNVDSKKTTSKFKSFKTNMKKNTVKSPGRFRDVDSKEKTSKFRSLDTNMKKKTVRSPWKFRNVDSEEATSKFRSPKTNMKKRIVKSPGRFRNVDSEEATSKFRSPKTNMKKRIVKSPGRFRNVDSEEATSKFRSPKTNMKKRIVKSPGRFRNVDSEEATSKPEANEKKEVVKTPGSFGNVLNKILKQEVGESKPILAKSIAVKEETKQKKELSHIEKKKAKFDWEEMCRVKPDVLEREKERKLQRIATRGVVALFNAVRQQQRVVAESKKDKKSKVLITETKKSFISKLHTEAAELEEDDNVTWNALRDDFMSNTSAKDWDKEDDDDDAGDEMD